MNLLKDIGAGAWQVFKTVAPTMADTAAGPFAPLVDPIVRKVFGTSEPAKVEAALLNATPDQLLTLKNAESEHIETLTKLGIDRDKLGFDDVANARQMQIETKDPTVKQLAWLVVGGFIVFSLVLAGVTFIWPDKVAKVPIAAWTLLTTLLTFLAAESKQACAFFFGSTSGSQAKDATIASIANQP